MLKKPELITSIVEKTGLTKKDAEASLNATIETIQEALAQDKKVQLVGFGTFEARERGAREGRNLHTGETIQIEASKYPAFKAGKSFKEALKK